jgi:LuxR family maltose regulon positive regulatory protein
MAYFRGDVAGVVAHARQALACLPESPSMLRIAAVSVLGDAYSMGGQFDQSAQAYRQAISLSRAIHNVYFVLLDGLKLATNRALEGETTRAIEMCREQLAFANENGFAGTARAGGILAVWSGLLREQGDLDEALERAQQSWAWSKQGSNVVMSGMALLVLARVQFSRGNWAGVEQSLSELDALGRESDLPLWLSSPLAAWKARLWLAQGRMQDAVALLRKRGVVVEGEWIYVRIDEYLVLVRLLIARATGTDLPDALRLLGRLSAETERVGLESKSIEMAALEALAWNESGDPEKAMAALERALSSAAQRGYVQLFVDEGRPMAELLYQAVERDIVPQHAGRVLAGFGDLDRTLPAGGLQEPLPRGVEALSEREIEVLELVAEGLSNREIARALLISLSTVKVHTYHIYGKLDVHSRTQAVAKARALGILPPSP